MKRRTFIQTCVGGALALTGIGRERALAASQDLTVTNFLHPPESACPKTWWHWMNGNISAEGITLDLEFLKRAGLGGFQIFQVGVGIPKGPVAYGGSEWLSLLQHAASEADRLGLEFDMMNCPGWSSSGGPWITPALSMQQFTWSEASVQGGRLVSVTLPQPYTKHGYYQDAFVVAFPALPGEERPLAELLTKATTGGESVDASLLTGSDLWKGIEIQPSEVGEPGHLLLEFAEPFEARSISLYLFKASARRGGRAPSARLNVVTLEASDNGVQFRKVCHLDAEYNNTADPSGEQHLEVPSTTSFPAVRAKYYRLLTWQPARVAAFRLSGATYITDWPHKANFAHRTESWTEPLPPEPLQVTGVVNRGSIVDPASVVDLTQDTDSQGRLSWKAPAGDWTVLRLGHTTVGVENHPAPDGGLGLECDKFSRDAYDFHFNHFFGKLFSAIQPLAAKGKAGATIDSYEVGMQTWTAKFPEEFQARRGYDLKKYLPALTGRVVGSGDVSDRFLWDFRRTCADLMADYYYGRFAEQCHQHGMKAYAEPYSGGPFEEMQSGSKLDIPMGEFWVADSNNYSVKLAGSIGHTHGKPIIAAESYTGAPELAKWQQYPYAMKAEGDWMYTQGLNQYIFHVYAMQPNPTAAPGMTMGPFGWMHSRNNDWANQEWAWIDYVKRCQHMLQQGHLVADLLYFKGVNVPVNTPMWPESLSPTPPEGYYYDVANVEVILERIAIKDGRIVLPDGVSYKILVLPEDNRITLELLQKIQQLVNAGMCLVGPKPAFTPGLTGYPESDKQLRRIADEIWGDLNGSTITERTYGQGRVFWGQTMIAVLDKLKIMPDCEVTSRSGDAPINFIHRRAGSAEIYFLANRRRQSEDLVCTFRVEDMQPEFWNPETGEIVPAAVYDVVEGGVRVPIRLGPAGSLFVVFRSRARAQRLSAVTQRDKTLLGCQPFPVPTAGRYPAPANNFTISVWIMPDTDMNLGEPTSFVFYPPAGEVAYGAGHTACGLVAARNGVSVFERTSGNPKAVLTVPRPIEGWTHLALVYQGGAPALYLNGELVGRGQPSGNVVHPGLGEAFQRDGAEYFYGNMSEPQLFDEVLSGGRITQLASAGLPEPEKPPALEPWASPNESAPQSPKWIFWQDGHYTIQDGAGESTSVDISRIGEPMELQGPWHVAFPPNLGAPAEIVLPELVSLRKHAEPGVKYFSGTATYTKQFDFSKSQAADLVYLDLGRVQVAAEVRLNGKDLGALWKPPYRVNVTEALDAGENTLEVRVSNLWVNRLIGDEQLPPENSYGPDGAILQLPAWYVEGKPKPAGGRIAFATWNHYEKNSPLVESGLLGPVRLRRAILRSL